MKNLQLPLLLLILLLLSITGFSQVSNSETDWRQIEGRDFGDAKWYEIMDRSDVTFKEVQKAFYKEWEGRAYEKSQGYKQFKRWELTQLGREDDFVALKQGKRSSAFPSSSLKSAASANWVGLGPTLPSGPSYYGIGRVDAIAFHPTDSNILYAGTPNGGLWKSSDNGSNWSLISGNNWPHHAISDICVNPNDGQNIFVATGTRDGNLHFAEEGIMKSTNGGATWTQISMGLPAFRIFRLIMDPNAGTGSSNSNKLLVSTNDGIYYSTNSGATWTASSMPMAFSGRDIYDIEYKPGNSNIVYATTDGLLARSTDGGVSFTTMSGVPFTDASAGRTAIAVTPDDVNAVYYLVSGQSGGFLGVYKYNGTSFTTVSDGTEATYWFNGDPFQSANNVRTLNYSSCWFQNWYNWSFAINPADKNDMMIGAICIYRTNDGGNTWKYMLQPNVGEEQVHVDVHALEYQPSTSLPYAGTDGGVYQWENASINWNEMYEMDIAELYTLAVSETNPNYIFCGAQDNGGFYKDGASWNDVFSGDNLSVELDPINTNVLYRTSSFTDMRIQKSIDKGLSWTTMLQESIIGEDCPSVFSQPEIKLHPCLRHVLYTGFVNVHKSTDGGDSWINISNGNVGGYFKEILEIAPSNANYIYTSTTSQSNGGLYRTANGGASWSSLSWPIAGLSLMAIDINDTNPNNVFAAMSNGKVYESSNGGTSWVNISSGLPSLFPFQIRYLHGSNKELYLATDKGVYYKNGSANWTVFNTNMPFAKSRDIELLPYDDKAYVATYGRGVWSSPLNNPSSVCYTALPTISPSGTLCSNGLTTLTASNAPSGYAYQWYVDDQVISGATAQTYVTSNQGNYSVVYTGACKSFSSDMVTLGTGTSIPSYQESFETSISFVNTTTDDIDWINISGATLSSNTGPSGASHLNRYNYVEASSPSSPGDVAELVSDCYDLSAYNTTTTLLFDSHLYGSGMGSLEVQLSNDSGVTWTSIFLKSGDQGNQWNSESVDISSYIGSTVLLKFIGTLGTSFTSDIAIDHVRFSGSSNCPPNYAGANQLTNVQSTPGADFETDGVIESNQTINANTDYDSGTFIELLQGFEVKIGKLFHAFIDGCGNLFKSEEDLDQYTK